MKARSDGDANRREGVAKDGAPSQFTNTWQVPTNETGQPQIYEITVSAFQQKTGNTGVEKATVIIPPASTPSK